MMAERERSMMIATAKTMEMEVNTFRSDDGMEMMRRG